MVMVEGIGGERRGEKKTKKISATTSEEEVLFREEEY